MNNLVLILCLHAVGLLLASTAAQLDELSTYQEAYRSMIKTLYRNPDFSYFFQSPSLSEFNPVEKHELALINDSLPTFSGKRIHEIEMDVVIFLTQFPPPNLLDGPNEKLLARTTKAIETRGFDYLKEMMVAVRNNPQGHISLFFSIFLKPLMLARRSHRSFIMLHLRELKLIRKILKYHTLPLTIFNLIEALPLGFLEEHLLLFEALPGSLMNEVKARISDPEKLEILFGSTIHLFSLLNRKHVQAVSKARYNRHFSSPYKALRKPWPTDDTMLSPIFYIPIVKEFSYNDLLKERPRRFFGNLHPDAMETFIDYLTNWIVPTFALENIAAGDVLIENLTADFMADFSRTLELEDIFDIRHIELISGRPIFLNHFLPFIRSDVSYALSFYNLNAIPRLVTW